MIKLYAVLYRIKFSLGWMCKTLLGAGHGEFGLVCPIALFLGMLASQELVLWRNDEVDLLPGKGDCLLIRLGLP
jgi:hypothetical protein